MENTNRREIWREYCTTALLHLDDVHDMAEDDAVVKGNDDELIALLLAGRAGRIADYLLSLEEARFGKIEGWD